MDEATYLKRIIAVQSRLVATQFNLDSFMQLVVKEIKALTGATGAVIELVEGEDMVYKAATGTIKNYVGIHLHRNSSISGLCVKSRKILESKDTEQDSRVDVVACRKVKARSLIVAPLFHQGKTVGVLKIISKKPNGFKANDTKTLQIMAGLVGSALAHQIIYENEADLLKKRTGKLKTLVKTEKVLRKSAHYDLVTGLPNRSLFYDRLQETIKQVERNEQLNALMYLDIDHFKLINDTYGHDMGDKILKTFARRLQASVRAVDTVARLGGDEFVALLMDIKSSENGIKIAEKIINKIKQPIIFKKEKLCITTSIGLVFFNDQKKKYLQLIKQADKALYLAKEAGRNTIKIL